MDSLIKDKNKRPKDRRKKLFKSLSPQPSHQEGLDLQRGKHIDLEILVLEEPGISFKLLLLETLLGSIMAQRTHYFLLGLSMGSLDCFCTQPSLPPAPPWWW